MLEEKVQNANPKDPTVNVREMISESSGRLDDLQRIEVKRIDERIDSLNDKIDERDSKYQVQFIDSKEAVGTAFTAQEKAISAALIGTKEAITKSDTTTDKRFDLLSEKIDGVIETISKSSGASGLYVTTSALSVEMGKLRSDFQDMLKPVVDFMNNQTGKATVADPAMTELTKAVEDLVGTRSQGISASWGVLVGAVGFIATLIAIFFALSK